MKFFQVQEIVDKETYNRLGDKAVELFNPLLLLSLDHLREFFNAPITVNNWHIGGNFQWRGFRNKNYNGYKPGSEHSKGNAIDCDIAGYTAEQARKKILENKDNPLLISINRLEGGVSWLHWDLKPVKNRIYVFKA